MRRSKRRNSVSILTAVVLTAITTACVSSSYRVSDQDGKKLELMVTPDRVLLQCELASELQEIPYGFMIHVLDEEKTVLSVIHGKTLAKSDCMNRIEKIGRILKTGKKIYIAGVGDIDEPRTVESWQYNYPGIGTFHGNGRVIQLFAISNENGLCFSSHNWEERPCPSDGFPIKDNRAVK